MTHQCQCLLKRMDSTVYSAFYTKLRLIITDQFVRALTIQCQWLIIFGKLSNARSFLSSKCRGICPRASRLPRPERRRRHQANVKVNITRKYISIKYDDLIIRHGEINSNIINHIWPKNNKINVFLETLYSDIDNQCHLFATLMCCRHPHIFCVHSFSVHFMHCRSLVKS